jgi:hypothetical protein
MTLVLKSQKLINERTVLAYHQRRGIQSSQGKRLSNISMPHSADELLRCHTLLLSERVVWESHWAEVAQRVLPRSDFFRGRRKRGEEQTETIF